MSREEHRLVLDTNTLISRMLLPKGVAGRAVDKALESGVLLMSEETLAELVAVLNRPKFDRYVSLEDRRQFLRLLGGVARIVPIHHRITACRDMGVPRSKTAVALSISYDTFQRVCAEFGIELLGLQDARKTAAIVTAADEVQALEAVEIIEQSEKFVQAGATSLLERVYRIQL